LQRKYKTLYIIIGQLFMFILFVCSPRPSQHTPL
jgi:hypothetical protein